MTAVLFGCATDNGMVRDHNEDNLLSRPQDGLWIVADGMGGYEGGEVASGLVVEHAPAMLAQGMTLAEALAESNNRIHQAIDEGEGAPGMGSTAVALQLEGSSYRICWVGDSRAYLFNGSSLQQLTRDHSYVQQLIDSGIISADEAEDHPQRNVITQALGSGSREVRVDTVTGNIFRGERLLLCSDGLTSELSDSEIATILARQESCQATVDHLIAAANKNGGHDNITVILVEASEDGPVRAHGTTTMPMRAIDGATGSSKGAMTKAGKLLLAVSLGVIAALAIGFFWSSQNQPDAQIGAGGGASLQQKEPVAIAAPNEPVAITVPGEPALPAVPPPVPEPESQGAQEKTLPVHSQEDVEAASEKKPSTEKHIAQPQVEKKPEKGSEEGEGGT